MLDERNGNDGYYGTPNQFALLERDRLNTKAIKIMNELNDGYGLMSTLFVTKSMTIYWMVYQLQKLNKKCVAENKIYV